MIYMYADDRPRHVRTSDPHRPISHSRIRRMRARDRDGDGRDRGTRELVSIRLDYALVRAGAGQVAWLEARALWLSLARRRATAVARLT